ncbi:PEP-CTERM sorting domain-containing protein [Sandarakinorhabdus sp.]|uniref:PEP-CTERM sorting domain-containing protein n=1 Tax=Sandarakinorhabdus sp. TaxID=1916663 RepID=UPI0033407AD3
MTDQPAGKLAGARVLQSRPAVLRSQQPQAGAPQPMTLARLRGAPQRFAAEPLVISAGANQNMSGPPLDLALAPTPEPETWMMFIAGMLAVGLQLRRRPQAGQQARG